MNKEVFIEFVKKMKNPIIIEDNDPYRDLLSYSWALYDKTPGIYTYVELPGIRVYERDRNTEGMQRFDKRLEKTRQKYANWLKEALTIE